MGEVDRPTLTISRVELRRILEVTWYAARDGEEDFASFEDFYAEMPEYLRTDEHGA